MELGVGFKEELQGEAVKQDGLATVVWHEGKEKYFVNLLDTDLKKVFNMRQYRKEKYMQDGRHLLVLTQNGFHRELLEEIRHVELLGSASARSGRILGTFRGMSCPSKDVLNFF
ncbi:hypothetical protein ACA29_02915 [Lederbergia galactosidilytica]|uniref:Uncharacterized protein n=1 Tax=Lederbergia galactosidilytica TaxID=217031 RepID=A0A0Q9Y7K4_9BACI|nr:hypothetical protein ACA29_02915 [Lederbergia galactosidilytica]